MNSVKCGTRSRRMSPEKRSFDLALACGARRNFVLLGGPEILWNS